MPTRTEENWLEQRFRSYMPVVIDIETAGFNDKTDAVLQIGACTLTTNETNQLVIDQRFFYEVAPFVGANLEKSALQFTGINPDDENRGAIEEAAALKDLFTHVRESVKRHNCKRAILVGHNAFFDLGFLNAAIERSAIKRVPFHPFSTLDTVSLGALYFQHTVLAKCCLAAGIDFDNQCAHNAIYDAEKTAELFCQIVNDFDVGAH